MNERTFTEEQIQALMKRATEMHVTEQLEQPGLTQNELEQIAADAGIPPKYLRAAIHESDKGPSKRDVSGHTKTHVYIERVVPGELSDDEWHDVVLRLRKAYTSDSADLYGGFLPQYGRGISEHLGSTREWRHTSSLGVVTTVTIRSAEGNQHISFQRRVGLGSPRIEGLSYGFLLAMLTAGISGAVLDSALAAVLVLAVVWAFAAPGIEYLDRRWRKQILTKMHVVADDISGLIRNHETVEVPEPEAAGELSAEPQKPLISLDDAGPYMESSRRDPNKDRA